MKTMKTIILIILAILALLPALIPPAPSVVAGPAPRLLAQAHAYHGITYSYMMDDGERYFDRDGKRCPLFTKGFWKEVRKS